MGVLSFKDGDDGEEIGEFEVVIKTASNGYIVDIMGDEESTEVFLDKESLIERLKEIL